MRDRGQLVLAAALVIATILVGLALVLNSVIFTENLATRQGPEKTDANTYRADAIDATTGAIVRANERNNTTDDAVHENVTAAVTEWSEATARERAAAGIDASVTVADTTNGTLLLQANRSRNYTAGGSQAGDGNWTLADADGVRQFRLNVSRDSLHQSSVVGDLSPSEYDTTADESFHVVIDDGGDVWRVYAFNDSDVVRVFVEDPSGSYHGGNDDSCQKEAGNVTIKLANASVAGQHCDALGLYPASEPHTVRYRNATLDGDDRAAGSYRILVEASSVNQNPYYDRDSGDSPFTTPAIYAATVRITHTADEETYTADSRVVP